VQLAAAKTFDFGLFPPSKSETVPTGGDTSLARGASAGGQTSGIDPSQICLRILKIAQGCIFVALAAAVGSNVCNRDRQIPGGKMAAGSSVSPLDRKCIAATRTIELSGRKTLINTLRLSLQSDS
jgi:hypothetical protein